MQFWIDNIQFHIFNATHHTWITFMQVRNEHLNIIFQTKSKNFCLIICSCNDLIVTDKWINLKYMYTFTVSKMVDVCYRIFGFTVLVACRPFLSSINLLLVSHCMVFYLIFFMNEVPLLQTKDNWRNFDVYRYRHHIKLKS